jgi:hypothetical protein
MKNIIIGAALGIGGTLFIQKLYRENTKFHFFVDKTVKDLGLDSAQGSLNIFDRLSLIWQRCSRKVFH